MIAYNIVSKFIGYRNKTDLTNIPQLITDEQGKAIRAAILVAGSQNVISNDSDRVGIRKGYTLYGSENTSNNPIRSSYDWLNHRGEERNLRHTDDELQYKYVDSNGVITWRTLKDSLSTSQEIFFAEYWDTTELQDSLLFVDGSSSIFEWSGAITTIASVGANTLTKSGSTTWAEEGFFTTGTRKVVIGGVEYTYTGGEATTTLTGVTPDPAAASPAIAADDIAHQAVKETGNGAMTGIPSAFDNDLIGVLYNQIYIASTSSRYVYVSKQNNYKDFSFTSTRLPGEGALFTLDGAVVGFTPQEDAMYVTAGVDHWYQTVFQKSSDLTKETLDIKKLNTTSQEAAKAQGMIAKIKNEIVYISNEPTLDTLGRVENIDTPQSKPLSDPIKVDFDDYDFTNAHIKYHKNNLYISVPAEGLVLIRNLEKGFWEAPQVLPVRCFAIIRGSLYGHSSQTAETYKLFDGTSDNGNPIEARAGFAYLTGGVEQRANLKTMDEFYVEGYISSNTVLSSGIKYDFGGFTQIVEQSIDGNDESIIFATTTDNSFGKHPIGSQPLGSVTDSISGLPKFRVILTAQKQDFFEYQPYFESNEVDYQWELLAFGGNDKLSTSQPTHIKQ